jgi:hypothetical protein
MKLPREKPPPFAESAPRRLLRSSVNQSRENSKLCIQERLQPCSKTALYQGMALAMPQRHNKIAGFRACVRTTSQVLF